MCAQYDEDLSQNEFFKEIKRNHKDILEKSAEENWIICVPRSGSLIIDDNLMDIVLDHVLIKEDQNNLSTLSKKKLVLDNRYLKVEQNTVFSRSVRVLFEETHYIREIQKCTVWCVERPLFLSYKQCNIQNNINIALNTIQDCVDFLYSENFGHNILEGIQKLCSDFWSKDEPSFELESLQCQKDCIGNLYSQCLQLFCKRDYISEKCEKNVLFLDNSKVAIETYMQYCLGKRLMYSINTVEYINDSIVNKIIRNSSHISLKDLNISFNFSDLIFDAKYELCRINNHVTCLDKLNCLSRTFNILNQSTISDHQMYVTSDDFLQILVYLILQSNIPNWMANLTYLREFNFATVEYPDQNSFLLTSLEAAIEFIKSSEFLDITGKHLNDTTQLGDSSLFYTIYSELNNKSFSEENFIKDLSKIKIELCHPLCTCQKCKQFVNVTSGKDCIKMLNKYNQNFFMMACMENNVDLLEVLFTFGFDINFKDSFGKTALHYAAENGFQDILLLLVNSKANVNVIDNNCNTPLHLACDKGHDCCVKALIYSSPFVEVNLQNNEGETPLFLATRWGYIDIIKILLENGASVCVKNKQKVTVYKLSPNFYITKLFKQFGSYKSINILGEVSKDISINSNHSMLSGSDSGSDNMSIKKNGIFKEPGFLYGCKPKNSLEVKQIDLLLKTIESNDLPLSYFYLGYNSSFVRPENFRKKCHPLCTCILCLNNDDFDILDINQKGSLQTNLRVCKFNINICNSDGFTPLHIAAKFGRTEILRILLDSGAILNVRTFNTLYTPLHLAVMFQRVQSVKELLKCGNCDVDAQDHKGNTPLYYACIRNSNLKIIEILLQNNANCQKKNCEEKTILQECEEKNLFRVCKMLKTSMGSFSPNVNKLPLEMAREENLDDNISTEFL